jgi:anti-anti-sigma factor
VSLRWGSLGVAAPRPAALAAWRGVLVAAEGATQPASDSTPSGESVSYVVDTELFSVTVQQLDDAVLVVHVAGELDMLTGPSLQDHLSKLLATQPERLIIDLSGVSFLGSTGLEVLIKTKQTAAQQGTTLQLGGTHQRAVARPLEITGLACLFQILPSDTQQRDTTGHQ